MPKSFTEDALMSPCNERQLDAIERYLKGLAMSTQPVRLKYTSLASVISVTELLFSAQQISAVNFQVVPLLLVASIWYLVLASILQVIQDRIERHFNRGIAGSRRARSLSGRTNASNSSASSSSLPVRLMVGTMAPRPVDFHITSGWSCSSVVVSTAPQLLA